MSKGIFNRGYLPHWDFQEAVQAITFRLKDSVPAKVIVSWRRELESIGDEKERARKLRKFISRFEDEGHGESLLRLPDCAEIVQRQLLHGHGRGYRLIEWCIMPNHVQVMIKVDEGLGLSRIVQHWKGRSALEINRLLNRSGSIWQREYHDRFVRDLDHYCDCRAYIRNNPVKARLCGSPDEWEFSSAGANWRPDAEDAG